MHALRQMLQQERDDSMHAFRVDEVVIVEDEIQPARKSGHLVDERSRQRLDPRRLGRAQRGQNAFPGLLFEDPQRGNEVRQEADRVVVALVQREPGYGTILINSAF